MKKIFLFLSILISFFSYGQAEFPEGVQITGGQPTNTTPTFLTTTSPTGVQEKIPSAYIEKTANKTGTITGYDTALYPNEKATHDALDLKLNISDLPTNLTLYPTNVASDVGGYVKMVTDIHDADYNTVAVDISTPTITTTDQLVASLITDAGVLIGQPGVFNATTFGNIRRLSGSGTATFYFKIFHRDLAGTETLIGTSSVTEAVTSSSYLEFTGAMLWDDGDFIDTDRIVIKYYANRIAGSSNPVYQFQFGGASPVRTLLPVPFSVVDAGYELKSNKSDTHTADTEKYYSATYINESLPTSYSKIVYVNATSPTTATIFDLENPPVTNDNLLKNDTANLYIGTDASTWVYLTGTGYVTKTISSATSNFNTFGTTLDAGNSKTSHITRSGPVTLTGSLNLAVAKISTTPNTSAGSYDILTRNSSTTALEKVSSISFGNWTYSGGLIYPKSLTDKVAIGTNSEGLGVAFTVKAISGSNNIAYFLDNTGALATKLDNSGISTTNATASVSMSAPYFAPSIDGGIIGPSALSWIKLRTGNYWEFRGRADYLADYSSTYTTRSLVDKAYTDAKITQTITNGVTDKSPSEDAVYDALANVTRNIINTTSTATVTGTLTETLLYTGTIPANSLGSESMPNLKIRLTKAGTVGTMSVRIKVNSVNDFATASTIGLYTSGTTVQSIVFIRNPTLSAGDLVILNKDTSVLSDENTASAAAPTTVPFNNTNANYIFISVQLTDVITDVARLRSVKLIN